MTDPLSSFLAAMAAEAIIPAEQINFISGQIIRFRSKGDKIGKRDAWAIYRASPIPHGWFGHWKFGTKHSWRDNEHLHSLSPETLQAIEIQLQEMETQYRAEAAARHEAAAQTARRLWSGADTGNPAHAYLARKGLTPFGIRQLGDQLLVPMIDAEGKLWNLQRISSDGSKRFLSGGRTKALFWQHGVRASGPLLIGEGYATMAACYIATGHAVVAALSAKNLLAVAVGMRELHQSRDLMVVADDDSHLPCNVGIEVARHAAATVGATLAVPHKSSVSNIAPDAVITSHGGGTHD